MNTPELAHAYRCCTCEGTGLDPGERPCRDCDGTGLDTHPGT